MSERDFMDMRVPLSETEARELLEWWTRNTLTQLTRYRRSLSEATLVEYAIMDLSTVLRYYDQWKKSETTTLSLGQKVKSWCLRHFARRSD